MRQSKGRATLPGAAPDSPFAGLRLALGWWVRMKLLVTGAQGMVGSAATRLARMQGHEVVACSRAELDIADVRAVAGALGRSRPDAVINCAALTRLDECEADPARAQAVNTRGPGNLAEACAGIGAGLVTISTDYVFDGRSADFYTQRDQPRPQSVYARTKVEGERAAQSAWARTSVVRTGYLFGAGGRNSLAQVVERARRGERLKAIHDAFGTPTYAPDLAARLLELAALDVPGVYHVCNAGEGASFEQFAIAALEVAGLDPKLVERVSFDSLARATPRPRNSRLKCLVSEALGLSRLRHWREALPDFVSSREENNVS